MVQVDEVLIKKVADLARLELNDSEISEYVHSIGAILNHVEQLALVDVTNVEPMYHGIDGALKLREDLVRAFPVDEEGNPKVLQSAPEVLHGGFKVPQVI